MLAKEERKVEKFFLPQQVTADLSYKVNLRAVKNYEK